MKFHVACFEQVCHCVLLFCVCVVLCLWKEREKESYQGEDVEDVVCCVERMGEQIHSLVNAR